jgi:hypothetical protein
MVHRLRSHGCDLQHLLPLHHSTAMLPHQQQLSLFLAWTDDVFTCQSAARSCYCACHHCSLRNSPVKASKNHIAATTAKRKIDSPESKQLAARKKRSKNMSYTMTTAMTPSWALLCRRRTSSRSRKLRRLRLARLRDCEATPYRKRWKLKTRERKRRKLKRRDVEP